ncbi:MAG: guanylate kinase [Acutalibacter sp.]
MKLVNIGFGNLVSADKVVAVVSPESAPIKRMVQEAKERGVLIDATFGRRTKAVLIMDSDNVVLSAILPETVAGRFNGKEEPAPEEEENMDKGLLLVISAPSGGGKGTILQELFAQDENLRLSVSATTRGPRPGEEHGKQYYFLSREEFEGLIQEGKMLEHAEYVGNYYGTPRQPVEDWMDQGHDVVLEIEVKGGAQVKQLMPECVSIFILPPSMKVLEKRLRGRGTEDEETIQKRLAKAREEIPHAKDYDYIVYNDALEDAVSDLRAIIKAEKLKFSRNTNSIERVLEDAETVR